MYFHNGTDPNAMAAAAAHYLATARSLAAYDLSYAHTFFWTAHDTHGRYTCLSWETSFPPFFLS